YVPSTSTTLSSLSATASYWFAVAGHGPNGATSPRSDVLGPVQPGTTQPTAAPAAGTTSPGLAVTGAVSPPTHLVLPSTPAAQNTLSWTASTASGVTGYQVYASVNGGQASPVGGPLAATATSLPMTGLSPAARYTFYVVAIAGSQQSSPSQTVGPCAVGQTCLGQAVNAGLTLATSGVPTVNALAFPNKQVSVSWSLVASATAYKVYRGQGGVAPAAIGTVAPPTLQYMDTVPATGSYVYYVTAVVNNVESSPSNQVTVNVTS